MATFDNANSENAERRHIKFPIVCSVLEKEVMRNLTKNGKIDALFKKLENFIRFQQSNQAIQTGNGIENGMGIKLNCKVSVYNRKFYLQNEVAWELRISLNFYLGTIILFYTRIVPYLSLVWKFL